jgi:lipopolysaccharide export system permease protein
MLFDSALRKDLSRTFGAAVTVLLTIVVTILLIKTLGLASRGRVNPSEVLVVLGLTVLGQMTTILALSLFITVVATFSRMHADSEMAIWHASGRGLGHFVLPVMRFAWPVIVVIFGLALVLWPWSNRQVQDLQQRFQQRSDIERVAPGQFQESASGSRVFFIDKHSPGDPLGLNVFVFSQNQHFQGITTARQGRVELRDSDKVLVLENGQQVLQELKTGETRVIGFANYEVVIDQQPSIIQSGNATRMLPTLDLLQLWQRPHQGELSWRMGLGLAAINLLLLGIAMTAFNPRVGQSYHLGLALFAFVAYYNLINVGQNWIETGKVAFAPFMAGLHGGCTVLAGAWLLIRHQRWHWRRLWPATTAGTTGART